jgi:hypothetical protein
MNKWIISLIPDHHKKRKYLAIGLTVLLAGGFTLWGIYHIGQYGIALFLLTPIFLGLCPVVIYGQKGALTRSEAIQLGFVTLAVFLVALLVFAIEGLICIAMVTPLAILMTWMGSMAGYLFTGYSKGGAPPALFLAILLLPTLAFMEQNQNPAITSVSTQLEIAASPETVWQLVIAFPPLNEPTEFLFKAGIAYPISATMESEGVGAVRHCNFTTGSFVEPITVWDKPHLLRFDVRNQPEPMTELSFWDIDAPHLHEYFVSKQGQFKLTQLPNGHTLLEGTTWYEHRIRPAIYWQLWSNYIVKTIHLRVLAHIKKEAEKTQAIGAPPLP